MTTVGTPLPVSLVLPGDTGGLSTRPLMRSDAAAVTALVADCEQHDVGDVLINIPAPLWRQESVFQAVPDRRLVSRAVPGVTDLIVYFAILRAIRAASGMCRRSAN